MTPDFDPIRHRYTLNGQPYPSATQVLDWLKLTPPYPETDDNSKKELGTAVHKAVELAMCDRLDFTKTSADLIPYVNGAMEKKHEMRIRPIFTEMRGVNLQEGYAGTLDLFAWVYDDELAVIDYKTGTPPRCAELQTAGYVLLVHSMLSSLRQRPTWYFEIDKPPRRFSMQLFENRAIVREYRDPYDFIAFIAAVRLYKWTQERRKSLNEGPVTQ